MPIKNLFIATIITFLIASCKKDDAPPFDETLQISFKMDGKEYSQELSKGQINQPTATWYDLGQGNLHETRDVIFRFGDSIIIQLTFGYINRNTNDTVFSYQSLKQALAVGSREYKCLECDSSIRNGVSISLTNFAGPFWTSFTNNSSLPGTNDQTGSHFTITDIKETKIPDYPAGFIVKGTFKCNIYKAATLEKSVLTDGKFTFYMYPY